MHFLSVSVFRFGYLIHIVFTTNKLDVLNEKSTLFPIHLPFWAEIAIAIEINVIVVMYGTVGVCDGKWFATYKATMLWYKLL